MSLWQQLIPISGISFQVAIRPSRLSLLTVQFLVLSAMLGGIVWSNSADVAVLEADDL